MNSININACTKYRAILLAFTKGDERDGNLREKLWRKALHSHPSHRHFQNPYPTPKEGRRKKKERNLLTYKVSTTMRKDLGKKGLRENSPKWV